MMAYLGFIYNSSRKVTDSWRTTKVMGQKTQKSDEWRTGMNERIPM